MSRPLPQGQLAEAVSLAGDWSSLQGARLVITGGTGFFGKWLMETLGAANQALELGVSATVWAAQWTSIMCASGYDVACAGCEADIVR